MLYPPSPNVESIAQAPSARQFDASASLSTILTHEADLGTLEAAWCELYAHCAQPTPFASWEWVSNWWRHMGAGGQLWLLRVAAPSGCLVALAPFVYFPRSQYSRQPQGLCLLGRLGGEEDGMTDAAVLLLRQGCEQAALTAIFQYAHTRRFDPRWDFVILAYPGTEAHKRFISRCHCPQRTHHLPDQVLTLPASWNALRQTLSKGMRDNLAYYPRRLRRQGHAFHIRAARSPADIAAGISHLIDLHHARAQSVRGTPHYDHLRTTSHAAFFRDALLSLAREEMAIIYMLEVGATILAAVSVLKSADTWFLYYSGFLPEWYDYSPVFLLHAQVIQDAIAAGISKINFLHGEAAWKSRWGAQPEGGYSEHARIQANPLSLLRVGCYALQSAGAARWWRNP